MIVTVFGLIFVGYDLVFTAHHEMPAKISWLERAEGFELLSFSTLFVSACCTTQQLYIYIKNNPALRMTVRLLYYCNIAKLSTLFILCTQYQPYIP